jgi:lysozyme family protein
MTTWYDEALEVLIGKRDRPMPSHEGGDVDDPDDPGGITRRGICLRFLADHGIDIDGDGDVDADDIRHLGYDDIVRLYRQYFWEPMKCDRWASKEVAIKLFDMAVNMGPGRATKLMQESVGCKPDGDIGPKTFAAVNDAPDQRAVLVSVCSTQSGFYRGIAAARPKSQKFLEGWLVRANCTLSTPCRTCRARLKKDQLLVK